MNIFESLGRNVAKGGWWATKKAATPFVGNWAGRMIAGAGIGAAYGGMTSDSNTSTGTFRDTLAGAIGGAGLVGGAWAGLKIGKAGLKSLGSGKLWKGAANLGLKGARMGVNAAMPGLKYAAKHPLQVGLAGAGIAAVGAVGYNMYQGLSGNEDQALYYSNRERLMNSTQGLVQGLNANRHG